MYYTRIYSDEQGNSHFEKIYIPLLEQGVMGSLSLPIEIKKMIFRETMADYDWDFQNTPERQFIVLLDGEIEITTSLGEARRFAGGDILLVEDTTGFGHKTEHIIQCIRQSLFITL